jgi:hypothetical protein
MHSPLNFQSRHCSKRCSRRPLAVALLALLLPIALVAQEASIHYAPVEPEVVGQRLGRYGGDDTRREQTLMQMFTEAGCAGKDLWEQPVKGLSQPNVICALPGNSERTILVGAHYDHIRRGDGVVDNWSGASLLPSLYQALKDQGRTHRYLFVGFSGEEQGMIGSRFYVRQMTEEEKNTIDAMVNMDTLGLAPTEYWQSYADRRLVEKLLYIAGVLKLQISAVDVDNVGSTDSVQFAAENMPSITIHSLSQQTWDAHILHTRKDKITQIRMDDYYETYRLVAAYLAFLDLSTLAREPVEKKSLRKAGRPN